MSEQQANDVTQLSPTIPLYNTYAFYWFLLYVFTRVYFSFICLFFLESSGCGDRTMV